MRARCCPERLWPRKMRSVRGAAGLLLLCGGEYRAGCAPAERCPRLLGPAPETFPQI